MGEKRYSVYIVASKLRVLYTGITSNLVSRVWQHKTKRIPGFTQKYNCNQLVYYETFRDVRAAIAREKQIKGWRRSKKLNLIESTNPKWKDLSADWVPIHEESKTEFPIKTQHQPLRSLTSFGMTSKSKCEPALRTFVHRRD